MNSNNRITCPRCDHDFQVQEALSKKIEAKFRQDTAAHRKKLETEFDSKLNELHELQKAVNQEKDILDITIARKLEEEKLIIRKEITSKIQSEYRQRVDLQKAEIEKATAKIQELQAKDIELMKLKRQMSLQEKEFEIRFQKQLLDEQRRMEDQLTKSIKSELELKILEKDKQLNDQRKLIAEMQRKAEQGSMQLQGEVQEIKIMEWLDAKFPSDRIIQTKKGAKGGDCIQHVINSLGQSCGKIYYESKRTKSFQQPWIDKFKQDMIAQSADIGVIVTKTMPSDMERMGQKSGIWICSLEEFKSLCYILRQMMIKINEVTHEQSNRGDKMNFLYRYLTGNEFRLKIEAIVDGFSQMQQDLQKEKNAMHRIWSQREKQIQRVLVNTTEMYGDIKGIAGSELPNVRQLELPIDSSEVFDLNNETIKNE